MLGPLFQEALPQAGRNRNFEAGEILFHRGDPVRRVHIVRTGVIRLERHTVDGSRIVLQRAGTGSALAEASLFNDAYHCDGVAESAGSALVYDRSSVLGAFEADPGFALKVMAAFAKQVVGLRGRLELWGVKSAQERVWQFLMLEAGEDRIVRLGVPLKQAAADLGLAHETFYRALATLEKDGAIKRSDRMIEII